ncbi:MAG: SAM-dependent methyltransferase, partial [Ardenticatenaceae bacterium]
MRPLTLETARWLTTGEAWQALAVLAEREVSEHTLISVLADLRLRHTEEQAAALLDQARLREKGIEKFGALARRMLFVEEALEQASGLTVARYRAARYAAYGVVADLGCGIGGDALALGERCQSLLALDRDPVRLFLAEYNLHVARLRAERRFALADWTDYDFPPGVQAAFADPSRR